MKRVITALWIVTLAHSQPPVPSPTKDSQAEQTIRNDKESSGESNETKSQPLPAPSDQVTSGEKRANPSDKSSEGKVSTTVENTNWKFSEILITFFTGVLAVLAGLQFWAMHRQAEFMRRGLRISIRQARISNRSAIAAKQGAEAATLSANTARLALETLERAHVVLLRTGWTAQWV